MENIWHDRLETFLAQTINSETSKVEPTEKQNVVNLINEIIDVRTANEIEPLLKYNTSYQTPREHLQNLLDQLKGDIYPIIDRMNAPFTALRNIMSFVDYISLLRFGLAPNSPSQDDMVTMFSGFSFGRFERDYRRYAKHLIQLYRHDLIHLTSPRGKVLHISINNDDQLGICYFSLESGFVKDDYETLCSLFRTEKFRSGKAHLRLDGNNIFVDIPSLFFDLVIYIEDYQAELSSNKETNRVFAEHFIEATVRSSLKLLKEPPIDLNANDHVRF